MAPGVVSTGEEDETLDAIPTHETPISARAVAQARAAAAAAPPETLFVGRESELERLDRALGRTREGAFTAVFVEGRYTANGELGYFGLMGGLAIRFGGD